METRQHYLWRYYNQTHTHTHKSFHKSIKNLARIKKAKYLYHYELIDTQICDMTFTWNVFSISSSVCSRNGLCISKAALLMRIPTSGIPACFISWAASCTIPRFDTSTMNPCAFCEPNARLKRKNALYVWWHMLILWKSGIINRLCCN